MKKIILYMVLVTPIAGSVSITSCSSEKKANAVKQDSIKADSANEPDAAKIKKDTV
jgi:hypothetical protein